MARHQLCIIIIIIIIIIMFPSVRKKSFPKWRVHHLSQSIRQ
jgi:hypothetical protein